MAQLEPVPENANHISKLHAQNVMQDRREQVRARLGIIARMVGTPPAEAALAELLAARVDEFSQNQLEALFVALKTGPPDHWTLLSRQTSMPPYDQHARRALATILDNWKDLELASATATASKTTRLDNRRAAMTLVAITTVVGLFGMVAGFATGQPLLAAIVSGLVIGMVGLRI